MKKEYIVSVDFGGTKILAALMSMEGEILAKAKVATRLDDGKRGLIEGLTQAIKDVIEQGNMKAQDIKAVSLGVPGSVNPFTGKIGTAPNLKVTNFNMKQELAKYIDIPILVENDVNLAALGIKNFELKGKGKNILVVFVGTGVGGALIFDNKLYRGSDFFAGEIGHMIVEKNGPKCGCGNKGCLEAIASRTAIVRDIKKEMKNKKSSKLYEILPKNKPIKSKGLALAVKKNDPIVIRELTKASGVLGTALANVTNLLNLDMIVLGGGVMESLSKFMVPKIKESFSKTVLSDAGRGVKIVATKLGDDAALYGGIVLASEINGEAKDNTPQV
ncbi:MAG: ROK family protein [Ignavibacteria bacterium]|nr:ROK family protein [Ignavibacteria bacterium]MCU7505070.1 ROK family protein [Ignavibacteria bacterium]MCU7515290.1 ROK family protein [Ignavibacteria bacterium]